jgi:hypothetical protein
MAEIADFRSYTNTPKRRHTFYCYCTQEFVQDQAIFFVLVEAYRATRSKRQGLLLKEWFIDGNIPDELQDGGYLTQVNVAGSDRDAMGNRVNTEVNRIGLTFADKRAKHGGGVRGFFGAAFQKLGNTSLSGDIFDSAQRQVVKMLDETGKHGFCTPVAAGRYNPDGTYQPKAFFVPMVVPLRKHLKEAGFNPDQLGFDRHRTRQALSEIILSPPRLP